uniref:Uncharacterized protein n=1 Tax=Arundo donax TaxID=35708 RepID=A0A0A8Y128_ARUDO
MSLTVSTSFAGCNMLLSMQKNITPNRLFFPNFFSGTCLPGYRQIV